MGATALGRVLRAGLLALILAIVPSMVLGATSSESSSATAGWYSYDLSSYSYGFDTNTNITIYLYNEHPYVTMYMHTWESPAFGGEYDSTNFAVGPGEFVNGMFDEDTLCARMYFDPMIGDTTTEDATLDNFWYLCGSIESANELQSTFAFVDQTGYFECSYSSSLDAYMSGGDLYGEAIFTIVCGEPAETGSYSYSYS